jgi:trans-aconitate methyltransferase
MYKDTARKFWTNVKDYPSFGSKQRRLYEVQWLVPKLKVDSLLDIGCGSGEFLELLLRLTDIKNFYACDISEPLLSKVNPSVQKFVFDIYNGNSSELPKVDAVLLWASLQYIFDDEVILNLLKGLRCKKLFVRTPCDREDYVIEKYSEELKGEYSSRYITLDNLLKLLGQYFTISDVARAYPDDIESKYGTKQWLIECTKED